MKNNLLLMLIEINKDSPKYIFGLGPSSVDTERQFKLSHFNNNSNNAQYNVSLYKVSITQE